MSGWSGPGRAYVRDQIARDQMRLLVQMAPTRDPDHKETPTLLDLVSAPEDRAIVELQLDRVAIGRPVIGPPGGSRRPRGACCASPSTWRSPIRIS